MFFFISCNAAFIFGGCSNDENLASTPFFIKSWEWWQSRFEWVLMYLVHTLSVVPAQSSRLCHVHKSLLLFSKTCLSTIKKLDWWDDALKSNINKLPKWHLFVFVFSWTKQQFLHPKPKCIFLTCESGFEELLCLLGMTLFFICDNSHCIRPFDLKTTPNGFFL